MRLNSINKKNMVGYIAIFLVLIFSSYWLYGQMRSVHQKNAVIVTQTLPAQALTEQIIKTLSTIHLDAFALYGTTLNNIEFNKRFEVNRVSLSNDINKLQDFTQIGEIKKQSDDFVTKVSILQKTMEKSRINWDDAREKLSEIKQSAGTFLSSVSQINNDISAEAHQRTLDINEQINTIQISVPAFLIIVSVIIGGAYFLSRITIANPVIRLAKTLDIVAAEKDLRKDILVTTNDEVGMAAKSINVLISSFRESSLEIRDAATTLLSSVGQLQKSASQGDQNVDQLSTQLEHLLNSISTLEDSIGQNEQRSQSASESALIRAQEVKTGAENVRKTSYSIVTLSENIERSRSKLIELQNSGNQVSSVVKAIADIAEQTNLLALNAAIEAARAGESGRGFAVVADEVRTLASRTHDSTHEINTILESIVNAISETVDQMSSNSENASATVTLAEETVVSLSAIEKSVSELSEENQHLSELAKVTKNDANAMRAVIDQIKNVADSVTQSSKETRESATQMIELSSRLDSVSNKFKSRH